MQNAGTLQLQLVIQGPFSSCFWLCCEHSHWPHHLRLALLQGASRFFLRLCPTTHSEFTHCWPPFFWHIDPLLLADEGGTHSMRFYLQFLGSIQVGYNRGTEVLQQAINKVWNSCLLSTLCFFFVLVFFGDWNVFPQAHPYISVLSPRSILFENCIALSILSLNLRSKIPKRTDCHEQ